MPNQSMLNLQMLQRQMERAGQSDESGLITGPFKRRKREKREAELAPQIAAEQTQLNQGTLGGLLTANDIDTGDVGGEQIQGLQSLMAAGQPNAAAARKGAAINSSRLTNRTVSRRIDRAFRPACQSASMNLTSSP